jgi:carbonic anhydrase/acetyltransferase-like protein (isoleucine patch superfamily)
MASNRYLPISPRIHPTAFVAASADLIGAVTVGREASVWYRVVIRADDEPVVIGEGTNIQDGTIVHIDPGYPTTFGKYVSVGHRAIVHGAQIADHVLISMGAIVLTGARIGQHAIIGAGALVTEGMEVPPGALVLGIPGKVVREVTEAQIARIHQTAQNYIARGRRYRAHLQGCGPPPKIP